ncbi:glycosyltransferase family 4 protein, partial [Candidatus Nitrosotalea sp. FS]|uniref:glycosyltransferase family 4 protein n=1 Tax=Candidatus Nitrosotalea sp. FS TaxID=2341021 RepID=UPI00140B70D8
LEIIKQEKIDIIHSNNFAPALAGSILSSLTSKPHITTVHDIFSLCGKNYWKQWGAQSDVSRINVWLAPFFEKMMIKLRHDCIHTVSEATRDDLLKFGATKPIHVIHNAIESSTTHSTTPNPLQFVYIGRLVFYKNIEVAIKAIEIAKKTEPNIKLVIVGNGPHRHSLEDLVKNLSLQQNIEFRGYVSSGEKSRIIAESNALVFPSLCEGFGLVILESFDQSRPVLVSNTRPMSDIVTHQKNGLVIDPHDENQWAAHMLDLIKNQQKSNEMGKNGNDTLTKSYSQDKMYQNLLRMYSDIIKT